ncbi:nucleotide-binding alpha-beta plait domain-containing protein [Artemisia annua]|uniref:Nucleotide-binding alpha-beta plait domain-containing protein n=1 Tax=Artemisia annua TaxID=35608 RepID=A0A2U1PVE9_ARTAN|nr:nucleotide-binding alpha-beta plait domain-containing protein [Artemisia annua]
MSSQLFTIPCSIGYFRVKIPRLDRAASPTYASFCPFQQSTHGIETAAFGLQDCSIMSYMIHGISWETTEDMLKDHFRSYGNVVGSVIAKGRMTGNPRGFAFVSFSDASALNKVVADTHTIQSFVPRTLFDF